MKSVKASRNAGETAANSIGRAPSWHALPGHPASPYGNGRQACCLAGHAKRGLGAAGRHRSLVPSATVPPSDASQFSPKFDQPNLAGHAGWRAPRMTGPATVAATAGEDRLFKISWRE